MYGALLILLSLLIFNRHRKIEKIKIKSNQEPYLLITGPKMKIKNNKVYINNLNNFSSLFLLNVL
jgi:hypothetical protein